jgi:SAM-dependent methyltransferase
LAGRGMITEIDAYDIAPGAIEAAQRLAAEAGFTGLRYHVADLEHERLAHGSVDVVFAHQSVHHVERLDELFTAVTDMLRPGGIFHLHEFVGPIRFQWTDAQINLVNRFLEALPPRLRALPSGQPRPLQGRATVAAMIEADPSEAIRSSEILPVLRRHFDILEVRELGGALLHLGLGDIAQNFGTDDPADRATLEAFFAAEDEAMERGEIGSDFVVITAVRRA